MALITSMFKLDVLPVPFKGSPAAISAVAGDQRVMGFNSVGAAALLANSGKIKPGAGTGKKAVAILPSVLPFAPEGIDTKIPKAFSGSSSGQEPLHRSYAN